MSYPSNLSDNQWEIIESLLPKKSGYSGYKRRHTKRSMINAMLYINKTGCQWRYLPADFPPWNAVYSYFNRLSAKGIFEKINNKLTKAVRLKEGQKASPSLVCIDSQSVPGDVNLEEKGIDGNKKINGCKRHVVTDVL